MDLLTSLTKRRSFSLDGSLEVYLALPDRVSVGAAVSAGQIAQLRQHGFLIGRHTPWCSFRYSSGSGDERGVGFAVLCNQRHCPTTKQAIRRLNGIADFDVLMTRIGRYDLEEVLHVGLRSFQYLGEPILVFVEHQCPGDALIAIVGT